jgi:hypothetical protein
MGKDEGVKTKEISFSFWGIGTCCIGLGGKCGLSTGRFLTGPAKAA